MSKKLIEFETEDGAMVLIESSLETEQAMRNISSDGKVTKGGKLEEALKPIKAFASSFRKHIESIDIKPDEVEVKTGLKFTAKTGPVLACFIDPSAEATFEVTLKWKLTNEPVSTTHPSTKE
ncbi:CU044_2847 family protein [Xanthocytophaga agilis]|uniref:CU044_2847 family protein n=1 Tax=Xanthocytophaga agilis TaxID=3048010 RepID=A0AAE3R5C4_9BACT|nr:CU044_2847 family protein [Xanthocytophaga agilis]MDJ1503510.1 CU044_2847 family protein [Xanthocytophaga agilis]